RRSTRSPTPGTRRCCSSGPSAPGGGRHRRIRSASDASATSTRSWSRSCSSASAGLFALYEAYHKWAEVRAGHPDQLLESRWWWVPLVVLGAAIVMESISFRTAVRESDKVRGDTGWVAFIRGAKAPELPVVLLEDLAALLGLAFALLGVSLTLLTHNGYFDVLGAAAIGVLLVVVAVVLATEV